MKNGTITLTSSGPNQLENAALLEEKITPPQSNSGTLGSMFQHALSTMSVLALVVIDFGRRKVATFEHDAAHANAISGAVETAYGGFFAKFIPDALNSTSVSYNVTDDSNVSYLNASVAPAIGANNPVAASFLNSLGFQKTSKGPSALVGGVEDALDAGFTEGILVVNQGAQTVHLYLHPDTSAQADFTLDDNSPFFVATFENVPTQNQGGTGIFSL